MKMKFLNIILLVYDISVKDTFTHLPDWIKDLTNVNLNDVIFALVGNKIDLADKRAVSTEEGEQFAQEQKCIFQEVSAKTGDGFSDLFYKQLFEQIRVKFRPGGQQPKTEVEDVGKLKIDQNVNKEKESKKCC